MRKAIYAAMCLILVAASLVACDSLKRLAGYGNEVASTEINLGQPFTLLYTPTSGEPHQIWLAYEVDYTDGDFRLGGPFEQVREQTVQGSWQLDLGSEGGPIAGSNSRKQINSRESRIGSKGSMSATVHLVELPASQVGQQVTMRGTWSAAPNTRVSRLRLIVTD